jgi:S-adenosylmethionine synthetase
MKNEFMFTSESITAGHPDKLCDIISDAIVDRFLAEDPFSKVRAECAVSSAIVFIASRFSSRAKVDFTHVARKVIKRIGYDQPDFNARICSILTTPLGLPIDKSTYFDESKLSNKEIDTITVKNQVTVFGFACRQSATLMPLPIWLAHKLCRQLTRIREEKMLSHLMPDGRVQVGVEFKNREPYRIHGITIMASQKPGEEHSAKKFSDEIREAVIKPVFMDEKIKPNRQTRILVNPEGLYLGGPTHHSGLTGRKNAIDTYGEYSRHSGKALSGKDPMRIDRCGAYAARYAAKNIVAAGLAKECEVMLSYAIGLARPVTLHVQTFGTGKLPDEDLSELVDKHFDFRLAAILKQFNLRYLPGMEPTGFFQQIAAYGHFGRSDLDLPWENTDRADLLSQP